MLTLDRVYSHPTMGYGYQPYGHHPYGYGTDFIIIILSMVITGFILGIIIMATVSKRHIEIIEEDMGYLNPLLHTIYHIEI